MRRKLKITYLTRIKISRQFSNIYFLPILTQIFLNFSKLDLFFTFYSTIKRDDNLNKNLGFSATKTDSKLLNTKNIQYCSDFDNDVPNVASGNLIRAEKVETGAIPMQTYLVYIKYTGGYCCALIFCIFCVINVTSTG